MKRKLVTEIKLPEYPFQINHKDKIYSIGSCFSDNIGQKLKDDWFQIEINPFGTLFNPISISNLIQRALDETPFVESDLKEREGIYFLWETHGKISHADPKEVIGKANKALDLTLSQIREGQFLIITFGTAYYYELKDGNKTVANCHKMPHELFERKKLTVDEILVNYDKLIAQIQKINPSINILFAVSPVRHAKDGFVENNRSKSALLLAIEELEKNNSVFYFPSYEIQMDELRDYRYYAEDLIHPNNLSVNIIYDYFERAFFNKATSDVLPKIRKIKAQEQHRPLNQENEISRHAELNLKEKKAALVAKIFG